jgi:hypothetical protein
MLRFTQGYRESVRELSRHLQKISFGRGGTNVFLGQHTPVPVELCEHSEPRCQLWREERDPLTWRDVPPR